MAEDEKQYDVVDIDDEPYDDTRKEFDELRGQVDEMIGTQMEKMGTIFKKSVIYTVIWSFVAIVAYFVWPGDWYFWIPAVIAGLSAASLVFVVVMRNKLRKTVEEE